MKLGSKKQLLVLLVLVFALGAIIANYLIPVSSKTVACTPDGKERYSIVLGQKSEYDKATAPDTGSDELCQLDSFKVTLHVL